MGKHPCSLLGSARVPDHGSHLCQDAQLTSLPIIPCFPPTAGREPPLEGRHCQHHTWITREGAPSARHGGSPERWRFFSQLEMPQWKTRAEVTFLASCSAKPDLLRVDPITQHTFLLAPSGGAGGMLTHCPSNRRRHPTAGTHALEATFKKSHLQSCFGLWPIVFPFCLRSSSRFFFLVAGLRPWLPARIA